MTDPSVAGRTETVAGASLVLLAGLASLVFRRHPGPIFLDDWGLSLIHPAVGNSFYVRVTDLRSVPVLVAGSILAAVTVVGRDRLRALACLVGPGLSVVLVEWLLKPVIARRFAGVPTFPSGTTTVVASVATAWALAVPRRFAPMAMVIGAFLVGLECIAVTALQWHLPTDALGGVAVGVGVVLVVDGLLHLALPSHRVEAGPPKRPDAAGATPI